MGIPDLTTLIFISYYLMIETIFLLPFLLLVQQTAQLTTTKTDIYAGTDPVLGMGSSGEKIAYVIKEGLYIQFDASTNYKATHTVTNMTSIACYDHKAFCYFGGALNSTLAELQADKIVYSTYVSSVGSESKYRLAMKQAVIDGSTYMVEAIDISRNLTRFNHLDNTKITRLQFNSAWRSLSNTWIRSLLTIKGNFYAFVTANERKGVFMANVIDMKEAKFHKDIIGGLLVFLSKSPEESNMVNIRNNVYEVFNFIEGSMGHSTTLDGYITAGANIH